MVYSYHTYAGTKQICVECRLLFFKNWTFRTIHNMQVAYTDNWVINHENIYKYVLRTDTTRCREMCECVHEFHRVYVNFQNDTMLQKSVQNTDRLLLCYQADANTNQNDTHNEMQKMKGTLTEWTDDCDARFAGLYTTADIFQKECAFINKKVFYITSQIENMSESVLNCARQSKADTETCDQKYQQVVDNLQLQISELTTQQWKQHKEIQNEKWMTMYLFVCMLSMMLYYA